MVGLDENLLSDLQASQVFICLHAALNLSRETELSRRVPREGEHYASALRSVAGWPQRGIAQVCQRLELIKMRTAWGGRWRSDVPGSSVSPIWAHEQFGIDLIN